MYSLILLFPLFGFLCAGLGGFYFGREGVSLLVCVGQICSLFSVFLALYEVIYCKSVVFLPLWHWIILDDFFIRFGLLFDNLTCVMLLIIMLISTCVHFYSIGYMSEDPYLVRFLGYLSLFNFFMLFLVCADNFLQMFIGWEGVGLCSYLLINFWYTRLLANKAALKAMIVNRISDVLLLLALAPIALTFKTLDFVVVFSLLPFAVNETIVFFGFLCSKFDFICFFLFIGAVGKSAQIFLFVWLPDAMEGPTPVSALLHAATMVTAGVFLLLRCAPLFEYSRTILFFIAVTGVLTSWIFSITGFFQYDIKKIIAYSTCSQLGYMFFCCGVSLYNVAIFHLFTHAFFKALLFLSAGSVIHSLFGEQDIRRMGSLLNFLPFTFMCFLVGSLTLMGSTFLSGFYSKDLILELTYSRYIFSGIFIYFMGTSGAFFTAFYSIRFIISVFFAEANSFRVVFSVLQESSFFLVFPMFFLSLMSVFAGYFFSEAFLGYGSLFFNSTLPVHSYILDSDFIAPFEKNLPLFCCVISLFLVFFFDYFLGDFFVRSFLHLAYPFFFLVSFFNVAWNSLLLFLAKSSYKGLTKTCDKGFLEFFGPYGLYKFFLFIGNFFREASFLVIFFHICLLFFSLAICLLFFFLHVHILIFLTRNFGLLVVIISLLIFDLFFEESNS